MPWSICFAQTDHLNLIDFCIQFSESSLNCHTLKAKVAAFNSSTVFEFVFLCMVKWKKEERRKNSSPLSAPWLVSVFVAFSLSERCLLRPHISFFPRQCWGWWKLRFYQHPRWAERAKRSKWSKRKSLHFIEEQHINFPIKCAEQMHGRRSSRDCIRRMLVIWINMFFWLITYLQWTEIGPSWPNCSFVLCTCPMKSMKPSPDFGTPCSGQSVNWNCLTVRDCPSWDQRVQKRGRNVKGSLFMQNNHQIAESEQTKRGCWSSVFHRQHIHGRHSSTNSVLFLCAVTISPAQKNTSWKKNLTSAPSFKHQRMFCHPRCLPFTWTY